jgi:hypothetical protein
MKLSTLATCAALASTATHAQEFDNIDLTDLYPLSPEVQSFNASAPEDLLALQACIRGQFEAFGLKHFDGSTTFLVSREYSHTQQRVYSDITFPGDGELEGGSTAFYRFVTEQESGPGGEIVEMETGGSATSFAYPMLHDNLLENGLFGQLNPLEFQRDRLLDFETTLSQTLTDCEQGRLVAEDLPAQNEQFWLQTNEIIEMARNQLVRCIEKSPPEGEDLSIILEAYSFPIEDYASFGFEDPLYVADELEAAYEAGCAES